MKKLADHIESLKGKRVIVRANFDVPIEDGKVLDTTRVEDVVSTLKLLLSNDCKVLLLAHYARPEGKYVEEMSLLPVATLLESLVEEKINFVPYSEDITQLNVDSEARINLVDNLRFWKGEESNDKEFARLLSQYGEVYVNQAFANCHREHASMVGIPEFLPSYAGLNLAREVEILLKSRNHPDKPLVVVIGGAKLETKVPLVDVFADVADYILVGGKIAIEIKEENVQIPQKVLVAEMIENKKDITQESAEKFAQLIHSAKTVIWNGTMGVFEEKEYQQGTKIVAEAVHTTSAFSVVGGGDTETALTELELESNIDFISTGGGAMLTFLSDGTLVALEKLK